MFWGGLTARGPPFAAGDSPPGLGWSRPTPSRPGSSAGLGCWKHPGFCPHVGGPIEPGQKQHLEDAAADLVRNPLSLKKLVYLDGEKAVASA